MESCRSFDGLFTVDSSGKNIPATVNKPQNYYTTPTSSVVDRSGNVTNYYRGGDTTNTKIIDSYNRTFNTIHNTTNNTNNYEANIKLSDFLNQYTTNNVTNKYSYSADFKSWYYDNTTNNYNYNDFTKNEYTQNNLYYNQDNSRYYISIDNSTDEYYLIDVQYSPTFVTVNYTYNNTVNNNQKVGDVTNVYYYELKDGRNSSSLTAAEVAGLDLGYDAELIDQVGRITLFVKPGVEYNIRQLDHYVFDQAVNAIGASIDIYGAPFFMEQIQRKRSENPKYRKLVEQYGKDKSKMRAAFRQGSEVHRELPGGELLPEAGELCPGHGRTPGTAGTGLGASECGDP